VIATEVGRIRARRVASDLLWIIFGKLFDSYTNLPGVHYRRRAHTHPRHSTARWLDR
jgi:hypothetical protein